MNIDYCRVDIARHLEVPRKNVEDDIRHLIKSLKHADNRLVITPAYCRKCDFQFNKDKLHKPGKCLQCNSTWIQGICLILNRKPEPGRCVWDVIHN